MTSGHGPHEMMMGSEKTLRLILGDQLNAAHSWFRQPDVRVTYVIMEIRQETDYVKHHIQKVASFFAAMRAFADHLRRQGHGVVYLRLDDPENRQTIRGNIRHLLQAKGFRRFPWRSFPWKSCGIRSRMSALPAKKRSRRSSPA